MKIESLNCPSCGAPLQIEANQSLTICLYCNATIRVTHPAGGTPTQLAAEQTLSQDVAGRLKQLLLAGRSAEAVELYRTETGATAEEAGRAVQSLGQQLSAGIIRQQPLNAFGLLLVLLVLALLAGGLAAGVSRLISPVLAIIPAFFGLLLLLFFGRALGTTLAYWGAKSAPASIVKMAPIGELGTSMGKIYTFRMLLEVRPDGRDPFLTEINLPVRQSSLEKLTPTTVLRVKYRPDDPGRVVYEGVWHNGPGQ
ncbi:MAG: hypothetical protein L0332_29785 [Chloroflexi bacterium]|nr:hypothetical protein [Chloroflexota bacterium]MCI0648061.1 hypothetical protein [Chloroflexota bacterium]MCI0730892.1 hypothetical protein [Chloroflexota bacterium]